MNILIIAAYIFSGSLVLVSQEPLMENIQSAQAKPPQAPVTIVYPKDNQKVRGEIKIYGKAKPGAIVKLQVTSTYYKKEYRQEKLYKGEGPFKRMNRTFSITADRSGTWMLKKIDLTNAGFEENFIIRANSGGKVVSVNVYDDTKPVRID